MSGDPLDGGITPDRVHDVPVADDVELRVREWCGAGSPVVLVHGLASNARLWDGVAVCLAEHGHRVVALDQRGHGQSSKPVDGYDMATVTGDLVTLLDALTLERPVVAGQSWGGNVVLELAARHPGRTAGVVAVDGGAIHLADQFPSWDDCATALAPPALVGQPATEIESMLRSMHPGWPESGIEGALACFEVRDDGTIAPWLDLDRHLRVLRGLWEHVPAERYSAVTDPVRFIMARQPGADPSWTASKETGMATAQRLLADADVHWINGDHDLHAQFPIDIARRLHDFATTADKPGRSESVSDTDSQPDS